MSEVAISPGVVKEFARQRLSAARANGSIHPQPCSVCGDPKVDAHHEDYEQPLMVTWLCRKHHAERHSELYVPTTPPMVIVSVRLSKEQINGLKKEAPKMKRYWTELIRMAVDDFIEARRKQKASK